MIQLLHARCRACDYEATIGVGDAYATVPVVWAPGAGWDGCHDMFSAAGAAFGATYPFSLSPAGLILVLDNPAWTHRRQDRASRFGARGEKRSDPPEKAILQNQMT